MLPERFLVRVMLAGYRRLHYGYITRIILLKRFSGVNATMLPDANDGVLETGLYACKIMCQCSLVHYVVRQLFNFT